MAIKHDFLTLLLADAILSTPIVPEFRCIERATTEIRNRRAPTLMPGI